MATKIPQDFLQVGPFGAPDINATLPEMNPPLPQQLCLIFGDIVVENDHAAFSVFEVTSLTTFRRIKLSASFTASGVMIP